MYRNWRNLIRPKSVEVDSSSLNEYYGEFVAEPLERGYGTTIGNALRRTLLSSIRGWAIVGVKIEGALHEFTSVQGIVEDVADIILNLKEVQLRFHGNGPKTFRIERDGQGPVSADDIAVDSSIDILNPEHHVLTISEGGKLAMEFVIAPGKGYVSAENYRDEEWPVDMIAIDAIFSPVRKVNFRVTNARVGQRTDFDKLSLDFKFK